MANEPVDTNKTGNEPDTNQIDWEARAKALESENNKLRKSVTEASADASKHKHNAEELQKQLNERMTEEERAKAEEAERNAARDKELEELRTAMNVAKYSASLMANDIGMDTETAKAVAEALNAGETDKVLDGIRKFIVTHDKSLRESALKNNPVLQGGAIDKTVSKAEFKAMSLSEMMAFKAEHPDLYAEYTK